MQSLPLKLKLHPHLFFKDRMMRHLWGIIVLMEPVSLRTEQSVHEKLILFLGSSLDCNSGLTWYQSGNYAQCCPTTVASCIAPTGCISGSQIYPLSGGMTTVAWYRYPF